MTPSSHQTNFNFLGMSSLMSLLSLHFPLLSPRVLPPLNTPFFIHSSLLNTCFYMPSVLFFQISSMFSEDIFAKYTMVMHHALLSWL